MNQGNCFECIHTASTKRHYLNKAIPLLRQKNQFYFNNLPENIISQQNMLPAFENKIQRNANLMNRSTALLSLINVFDSGPLKVFIVNTHFCCQKDDCTIQQFRKLDPSKYFSNRIIQPTMLSRILANFRSCLSTARVHNYYEILGLKTTASHQQIKQNYYKLAKIYHPDISKNPDAVKKFHLITEAFDTLSDTHKKRIYDSSCDFKQQEQVYRQRSKKYSQHNQKTEQSEPFEQQDAFFKRSYYSLRRPTKGEDMYESVKIDLANAVKGKFQTIKVRRRVVCRECEMAKVKKCFTCGGRGRIQLRREKEEKDCQKCSGKGYKHHCQKCAGEGFVYQVFDQEISIPKGVSNQTILRKEKSGHQGFKSKNGDLYIKVDIPQDDYFKIDGQNVKTTQFIPISVAVLGGKVQVKTLRGVVQITIAPGTQSGQEKRLGNLGLPSMYSKQLGDQIVQFKIHIPRPEKLKDSRSLYEALRSAEL